MIDEEVGRALNNAIRYSDFSGWYGSADFEHETKMTFSLCCDRDLTLIAEVEPGKIPGTRYMMENEGEPYFGLYDPVFHDDGGSEMILRGNGYLCSILKKDCDVGESDDNGPPIVDCECNVDDTVPYDPDVGCSDDRRGCPDCRYDRSKVDRLIRLMHTEDYSDVLENKATYDLSEDVRIVISTESAPEYAEMFPCMAYHRSKNGNVRLQLEGMLLRSSDGFKVIGQSFEFIIGINCTDAIVDHEGKKTERVISYLSRQEIPEYGRFLGKE